MKNVSSELIRLMKNYSLFKEDKLEGRYIPYPSIQPILEKSKEKFTINELGKSAEGIPVQSVVVGTGDIKILAWSQMHGNESTTTKAVFDLLRCFDLLGDEPSVENIKKRITLLIIPMLNPDGASRYIRENANKTDLNRDAARLKETESQLLRRTFLDFDPDFCFNLHDQRSIFSAGPQSFPATLSFLTPAMDEKREIYPERVISMQVVASMASNLRHWLPESIGRYNDEYNPNCTGDSFQSLRKPTILFEAGHFPEDYQREITRKYVVAALLSALLNIATGDWKKYSHEEYFEIPENNKLFYDIILRRAMVNGKIQDVGIQFKEILKNGIIVFQPYIEQLKSTLEFYGHREVDCENRILTLKDGESLRENVVVNEIYFNGEVLAINYQNI